MTQQEQSIADDKMRAEIANLNSLTAKLVSESLKLSIEGTKLQQENAKLLAEANHLKIQSFVAPVLAAAGLMGATAAITKLFF